MKIHALLIGVLLFAGCATIEIPRYIKDENPYRQKFYEDYDEVLAATSQSLEELGWEIIDTTDPSIWERRKHLEFEGARQLVIITQVRKSALVVGTRYARINAFVRSGRDDSIEVEIRYLTVNSAGVKTFYNYREDRAVENVFQLIEEYLN